MKIFFQYIIIFLIMILLILNIWFFVYSIKLGEELTRFEKETVLLKKINTQLENELSYYDSYQFAASNAASLGFVKKTTPLYLENLKQAFIWGR